MTPTGSGGDSAAVVRHELLAMKDPDETLMPSSLRLNGRHLTLACVSSGVPYQTRTWVSVRWTCGSAPGPGHG